MPEDLTAQMRRAQLLVDAGRPEDALTALAPAVAAAPDDPRVLYAQGLAFDALHRLDEARVAAAACVAAAPGECSAYVLLSDIASQQGDADIALQAAEQAVALEPDSSAALALLAKSHITPATPGASVEAGVDPALTALRRAISVDPDTPALYEFFAQVVLRFRTNVPELVREASTYVERGLMLDPTNAALLHERGRLEFMRSGMGGGVAGLARALSADPQLGTAPVIVRVLGMVLRDARTVIMLIVSVLALLVGYGVPGPATGWAALVAVVVLIAFVARVALALRGLRGRDRELTWRVLRRDSAGLAKATAPLWLSALAALALMGRWAWWLGVGH